MLRTEVPPNDWGGLLATVSSSLLRRSSPPRDPNCQGWRERARGLRKLVDRISPMEQTRMRTNQIRPESCWATAASVSRRIRYDPQTGHPQPGPWPGLKGGRTQNRGESFCMTCNSEPQFTRWASHLRDLPRSTFNHSKKCFFLPASKFVKNISLIQKFLALYFARNIMSFT